jgi:hypothetical protein
MMAANNQGQKIKIQRRDYSPAVRSLREGKPESWTNDPSATLHLLRLIELSYKFIFSPLLPYKIASSPLLSYKIDFSPLCSIFLPARPTLAVVLQIGFIPACATKSRYPRLCYRNHFPRFVLRSTQYAIRTTSPLHPPKKSWLELGRMI